MKRFIIISLLAAMAAAPAMACMWVDTHNYYLFSVYQRVDFSERADRLTTDNWKAYLGNTDTDQYFFFQADEVTEHARKKGDLLMVSYVENLQKYLACSDMVTESWDYPTKEELTERERELSAVRTYALGKLDSRLRSQHALLYMRCNMLMGRHADNVRFWEEKGKDFISSVYRDMMYDIYGCALLKTGRKPEAMRVYAELNDARSLMTCYYEKRSFEAIRREYQQDANSPVLPFLVQDFVNNAQEAYDARNEIGEWPGKLFVRDIHESESRQMRQFCDQVVSERKTDQPALWKSAKAWLEYLGGNAEQARRDIEAAVKLDGSERVRDNARALRLFIVSATSQPDKKLDKFLATELQWLEERAAADRRQEPGFRNHYTEVYDRLAHQVLVDKYAKAGRSVVAAALLGAFDEQEKQARSNIAKARQLKDEDYRWNPDYSDYFFAFIDTMKVDHLLAYVDFLKQGGKTELDRWLAKRVRHSDEFFAELVGTKYLRLGQWKNAADWLQRVPVGFINTQNITPYAVVRSYKVAAWLKKQPIEWEQTETGAQQVKSNYKLDFAREMQQMESGYYLMSGADRYQRAYDLAVRYYQASFMGDAWFLTRYGKSCLDSLRTNELDFAARTVELLTTAKQTDLYEMKQKALFALAFVPFEPWYEEVWDNEACEFVKHYHPQSHQYKALKELAAFSQENKDRLSPFVSKCDVLKQFRKVDR